MTRLDADELKESLTVDDVKILLAELGAEDVTHNVGKGELVTNTICHNHSGGSHKLIYYEESHTFHCYTECSCNMSIYSLIMKVYKLRGSSISFPSAIDYVATKTGKSKNVFGQGFLIPNEPKKNTDIEWLSRFERKKVELPQPNFFSEKILDVFSSHMNHRLFTEDNITPEVMDYYGIRYHEYSERIVIPHRYYKDGRLIALRGRATRQWDIDNGTKYMPLKIQSQLYSSPTYSNLYAAWENRECISRLKKLVIFESEKSVLQCASYYGVKNNFSVALSGRNISENQVKMIIDELDVNEVILAFDRQFEKHNTSQEDRDIEFLLRSGRKFSKYVRTFVLFDTDDDLSFRDAPSDRGIEVLNKMMKNKQEILNKE